MLNKLLKCILTVGVSLSCSIIGANQAQAVELINNSTLGYYNSSLGDLYPGDPEHPLALYFRGPNLSTGDPTLTFPIPPDILGVANLGTWLYDTEAALTYGFWSEKQVIPSTWAVNTETAILYEIDGGEYGISNLIGNFGVDNGIFIGVNGDYVFGATAPGPAVAFEYSNINLGSLKPGKNFIQVLRADHGGSTGYVVSITGDYNTKPIPEPSAALSMLVLGAFGLGYNWKRQPRQKI